MSSQYTNWNDCADKENLMGMKSPTLNYHEDNKTWAVVNEYDFHGNKLNCVLWAGCLFDNGNIEMWHV